MCGCVRHASSAAGGAEPALAGKRQQTVEPTAIAVQTKKTVGEDSAFQVGAKLAFNEVRHRVFGIAGSSEECLEVLAHRLVQ
jgi:hypothetical protein